MRRELPHAVDAYDPRLLSAEPPPGARPRRRRPRAVVARAPDPVRRGASGRREQLRLRLPRLDPLLSRGDRRRRRSRSRARRRARWVARDRPRPADERLRVVPRAPAAPARRRRRARPRLRPLFPRRSSRASTTSTARGTAALGKIAPLAHFRLSTIRASAISPGRPLAGEVEGLRNQLLRVKSLITALSSVLSPGRDGLPFLLGRRGGVDDGAELAAIGILAGEAPVNRGAQEPGAVRGLAAPRRATRRRAPSGSHGATPGPGERGRAARNAAHRPRRGSRRAAAARPTPIAERRLGAIHPRDRNQSEPVPGGQADRAGSGARRR